MDRQKAPCPHRSEMQGTQSGEAPHAKAAISLYIHVHQANRPDQAVCTSISYVTLKLLWLRVPLIIIMIFGKLEDLFLLHLSMHFAMNPTLDRRGLS